MEIIFKWVVLGLIVAGVAAAVRQFLQARQERVEAQAERERKAAQWGEMAARQKRRSMARNQ
jgi:hypothetical protein